jgi:hypothetical protein
VALEVLLDAAARALLWEGVVRKLNIELMVATLKHRADLGAKERRGGGRRGAMVEVVDATGRRGSGEPGGGGGGGGTRRSYGRPGAHEPRPRAAASDSERTRETARGTWCT